MIFTTEEYAQYISVLTGYEIASPDDDLLTYIEAQELQHILNYTNQTVIPDELRPMLQQKVVGAFLSTRKKDILGADNLQIATSIKEGDVQVNLNGSSDEQRLDSIIAKLLKAGEPSCFRQFRW